jgi:hypothetical protein
MIQNHVKHFFVIAAVSLSTVAIPALGEQVLAKAEISDDWKTFPTRTLADLPAAATERLDSSLSQFGGLLASKGKAAASGFFYATNLSGRWWLVDPEGCLFLDKGVTDVAMPRGASSKKVFQEKYGSESSWADQTTVFLRSLGFNNLGAWSDTANLRQAAKPMPYTRVLNFMSGYGDKRGGTYQQSGHMGYPSDCIFVFDSAFETYCDERARLLAELKNDPWLLGYFSDNELPLRREELKNYLKLPEQDPGHQAALKWLQAKHGVQATVADITPQDEKDFLALVVERYYRIVNSAIKKYDPNHLFLGSRFNGRALSYPEIFKAAGPNVDVVAVNYYRTWTPSQEQLALWSREAGKPIVITEWYAKAMDAGLANIGGAGWIVKTQRDRGAFYQNFTLGLLESKVCVGWDWFKYADNDPTNLKADPSNRDANKGIINILYQPYQPLIEAMKPLNDRAYSLVEYFDKVSSQTASSKSSRSENGSYAN